MKPKVRFTQEIREKAKKLGIDKIGFTRVEALDTEGERLEQWLQRGFHATMHWMNANIEQRKNPVEILPEAKSVISIAINYFNDPVENIGNSDVRLSRHVWGNDYHVVLKSKLGELWDFIRAKYPEVTGKIYVDAGPVMEKAWAIRAGIGWQGKNSITLTKEYGSWIFLGEILCNIEFDYDSPVEDLCGDCRLCIDACPTNAIVEPYVLNAVRCIAYQTIENTDECDPEIKNSVGQWIYGCDICQEVCPWNSKSQQGTSTDDFLPRTLGMAFEAGCFHSLDEKKFNNIFKNSSVRRISFDKFKRNIEIAMRNNETVQKE
jgi:epoxyqueuosine reductase